MPTSYTVKKGDCIYSISAEQGFLPDTLWNHPSNSALKSKRKDPFVLLPEDIVEIPDKRAKYSSKSCGVRHRFRKKSGAVTLRLQLLADGKPRANVAYTIELDGKLFEAFTNDQGMIEHSIPPTVRSGKLLMKEDREEYTLNLGDLDPANEPTGIQARLQNLGLYQGEIDGEWNEETTAAIKAFQVEQNLRPTGKPDVTTIDKLVGCHGC